MPDPALLHVSQSFNEKDLALVFLSNAGRLDKETQASLSAAGIAHYVAVSAGQIAPVIAVSLWALRRGLIALLQCKAAPLARLLLPHLLSRTADVATGICFALVVLYSATGSLLRIAVLQYLCLSLTRTLALCIKPQSASLMRLLGATLPVLLLAALAIVFNRNLMHDWSFLYAATGALGCSLAARLSPAIIRVQSGGLKEALAQMVCTQIICTALFWPLHPIHPGSALIANALAGPLVTWGIVPLTLGLTIGTKAGLVTSTGLLSSGLISATDSLLGCFRLIAEKAASLPVPWAPLIVLPAFSPVALTYLQALALTALIAASWPALIKSTLNTTNQPLRNRSLPISPGLPNHGRQPPPESSTESESGAVKTTKPKAGKSME